MVKINTLLFSPRTLTERMLDSVARTLWVCAYADAHENGELPEDAPFASHGDDWMDVAPPTPFRAYLHAQKFCDAIMRANKESVPSQCLWVLFRDALKADGMDVPESKEGDWGADHDFCANQDKLADSFAHNITMQTMGHGVGWFDDHEEFPMKLPHIEGPSYGELVEDQ